MTDATLRQALAFATCGWPVLPCQPGQKIPATRHGYQDATTDPGQITAWFSRHPDWNLAIATGAPGPDVLDVDEHGDAGNGYAAFRQLKAAGLLDGASAYVRTPSGGLHAYFTGSDQRNAHLPGCHLDFRSRGGYVLTPPSRIDGKPYQLVTTTSGRGGLDWDAVIRHLQPQRRSQRHLQAGSQDISGLARWVASQGQGNRNAGLFWAANRALDADPAADLSPPSRRRPPRRARRAGDHQDARFRPARRRPDPPARTRPPGRGRRPSMTAPTVPPAPVNPASPGQREAACEHVAQLRHDGGTYRSIATAAALSPATVRGLTTGGRRAQPGTATAVLKVTSRTLPQARLDAAGTRLRLRALHVMGHDSDRIARATGISSKTIRQLVRGDARTVSPRLRDAISELYDAWWDKRAPARTRFERGVAAAARNRAIAGNWCAPAALDDDKLDTPGYRPQYGWKPATGTGTAPDIHPPVRRRRNRHD
jgi:Bifunctional DNA primase/polymerase, N-terminal